LTSAVHSPRLERNIGLALLDIEPGSTGTKCTVISPGAEMPARVVPKTFYDAARRLAAS